MYSEFLNKLKKLCPELKILTNESMKRHTSFRIGGPAAVMIFPSTLEELRCCRILMTQCGIEPLLLGAGTNVLAPDEGLSRVVLCLKENFSHTELLDSTHLRACAGASLARLAALAKNNGLSGLEFAHGIPGTVGGGVYMNAGAYGGEMKQVVQSVTVMDKDGSLHHVIADENTFAYRTSIFENQDRIIVQAVFSLTPGDRDAIQETMAELMEKRKTTQPLELPSAGSTFKRPAGGYAAALIDAAGLKGFRIGNAAVSDKHAGFLVNLGDATACDVLTLIEYVQRSVQANSGIILTPEVRIW